MCCFINKSGLSALCVVFSAVEISIIDVKLWNFENLMRSINKMLQTRSARTEMIMYRWNRIQLSRLMSFTGTRDKPRSCSENKTSREINLQLIVCGLELCAYITLSSKFTKYVNYENVPSTTIHFLEANYTTPLGINTVLKNHFISVLPDSHREKYANLPFSLYAHSFRLG